MKGKDEFEQPHFIVDNNIIIEGTNNCVVCTANAFEQTGASSAIEVGTSAINSCLLDKSTDAMLLSVPKAPLKRICTNESPCSSASHDPSISNKSSIVQHRYSIR